MQQIVKSEVFALSFWAYDLDTCSIDLDELSNQKLKKISRPLILFLHMTFRIMKKKSNGNSVRGKNRIGFFSAASHSENNTMAWTCN